MKVVLQLRWLIIDDIRMVSARLFADVVTKLRSFARACDPYVKDQKQRGLLQVLIYCAVEMFGSCLLRMVDL